MRVLRGHARQHKRAGNGLVQPPFEFAAQHAPGFGERIASPGERIAPSLPGNDEDAAEAALGGLGQECSHLARSLSA